MLLQIKCFILLVADEAYLEQEAERKIGWLLKLFFAGTATFVGYQFFPYMGIFLFFDIYCFSGYLAYMGVSILVYE